MHGTWYKKRNSPRRKRRRSSSPNHLVQQRHEQLRGAAAHIPPPGRRPIHQPYNLPIKHGAHPVLARHERRQRKPDHEPHGHVPPRRRHERHAEHRGRRYHDQECARVSGPQQIARRPHHQPREYAARHRRYARVPDVRLRQVQVVADDGDQRRRRERGDEAGEEGYPGEVEGSHVRVCK